METVQYLIWNDNGNYGVRALLTKPSNKIPIEGAN